MGYSPTDSEVAKSSGITNQRIERLANVAFFREATRKVVDVILPLSDVGDGPAFYCVHSVTGVATNFRELAQQLSPTHRFYGIQAPTAKRNSAFAASIEQVGRFYANRLNEFQPTGPIILGGHSTGGVIALEMAQHLRALGREVSMLVILDGSLFNTGAEFSALYWLKVVVNAPARMGRSLNALRAFYQNSPRTLVGTIKSAIARLVGRSDGYSLKTIFDLRNCTPDHVAFVETLFRTQFDYVPQKYSAPVVVCAAKAQALPELTEVAWRKVAPAAKFVMFDGTHTTMLQSPNVSAIAEYLKQTLPRLEPGFTGPSPTIAPIDHRPDH